MSKYIPVEPEKWAEMVKAMSEVADLKAKVDGFKADIDRLRGRYSEVVCENSRLQSFCTRTIIPNELLAAENARLKAEVEQSKRINTELLVLSERQASDIRRLTKAGDERQNQMNLMFKEIQEGREAYQRLHYLYLTAKQGGQP